MRSHRCLPIPTQLRDECKTENRSDQRNLQVVQRVKGTAAIFFCSDDRLGLCLRTYTTRIIAHYRACTRMITRALTRYHSLTS